MVASDAAGNAPQERFDSTGEIEVVVEQLGRGFRWRAIIKLERAQTTFNAVRRRD